MDNHYRITVDDNRERNNAGRRWKQNNRKQETSSEQVRKQTHLKMSQVSPDTCTTVVTRKKYSAGTIRRISGSISLSSSQTLETAESRGKI